MVDRTSHWVMNAVGLAVLVALLGGACASAVDSRVEVAAVGRIVIIDSHDGVVFADFPTGRRLIQVGNREVGRYIIGDEIRIDSFGRPLPPVVGR